MHVGRRVRHSFSEGGRIGWISAALALVFAIGVASTAGAQAPAGAQGPAGAQAPGGAQGRGGGRGGDPNAGAPYTPAPNAKDLRAVLFNWMWGQGMLKGTDERDMVATLEYQAKVGTIQVDGQPCALSKYRASTNYQTFSQRIQYTCTRPNKQTYSNIEVVSWQYAWNEDTPGAEIAGTKGKVAAMPAQNRPCASANTSTRIAPEQGLKPTATMAPSPRRQPPGPAS